MRIISRKQVVRVDADRPPQKQNIGMITFEMGSRYFGVTLPTIKMAWARDVGTFTIKAEGTASQLEMMAKDIRKAIKIATDTKKIS